jgi:hypothetical protein
VELLAQSYVYGLQQKARTVQGDIKVVYLLGWFLSYFALLLWYLGARNRIIFVAIFFSYLATIIVIRYSGTDTYPIYELLLRDLLNNVPNELMQGLEPGFALLSKAFLWLTNSEVWTVRGIGVVFVTLLLIYLFRADRTELLLLFLYFIPVLVYQYGMNAIRAGLGLALVLLAWQALRRNRWVLFALLSLMSLLFHYSVALVLTFLMLFEISLKNWRVVALVCIFLIVVASIFASRLDYFESKLLLYSNYDSPTEISGLSRLALVGLLWLSFAISDSPLRSKVKTFTMLVLPAVGFQLLATIFYAGLRFLELFTFFVPLVLIREYDRHCRNPSKVFWLGMAVSGLLGAAFLYRNFLTDFDGQLTGTPTPFLPFRTIFDYKP